MAKIYQRNIKKWKKKSQTRALVKALIYPEQGIRKNAYEALISLGWQPQNPKENIYSAIACGEFEKCLQYLDSAKDLLIDSLCKVIVDESVNKEVAAVFGKIGGATVDKLILEMNLKVNSATFQTEEDKFEADWQQAILIGEGLVQIGEPAVEQLLKIAKKKVLAKDEGMRSLVAVILGQIGDKRAVPILIDALNEKSHFVGEVVSGESFKHRKAALNLGAALGLGYLRDPRAIEPLINVLYRGEVPENLQKEVMNALINIGEPSINLLLKIIGEKKHIVSNSAIYVLGKLKAKEAVEPLIAVLKNHKEAYTRAAVLTSLGEIGGEKAEKAIIEALNDPEPLIKGTAAEQIGENKLTEAGDALINNLECKDNDTKKKIIKTLGLIKYQVAVAPLIEMLKVKYGLLSQDVPVEIGHTLGRLDISQRFEDLISLLSHEYDSARSGAALALGGSGKSEAVPHLAKRLIEPKLKGKAVFAQALGESGNPEAVEPLIQALKDNDFMVRQEAAKALGLLKDTRAIQPLIDAFNVEKGIMKSDFQKIARQALETIGTKEAVEASWNLEAKQAKCFIATAVYGSGCAPEVMVLRNFRDNILLKHFWGKILVQLYNLLSPGIADFVKNTVTLRKLMRNILDKIVMMIR